MRNLVIFDLDETLVHATEVALPRGADFKCASYFVYVRPHLSEMLSIVGARYDIAAWSSSSRSYVDQVVAQIFSPGLNLKFAWCIDQCVQRVDLHNGGYVYIKDLRKVQKFGYALDRVIMVDDSAEKVARQPQNHLMIAPFKGEDTDKELLGLANQLMDPNIKMNPL